jgi:hypothetical protein
MSCGRECDCESEEAHDAALAEDQRAFLLNPGPPPADWADERVFRARRAILEARKRLLEGE